MIDVSRFGGRGVGYPVGKGDGCDCAGGGAEEDPKGYAVDYASRHCGWRGEELRTDGRTMLVSLLFWYEF